MAKYKLRNNKHYAMDGTTVESIIVDILDTELNTAIPKDEANSDYLEYLEWAKIDGNTIEAAD